MTLARTRYQGFNHQHVTEMLAEREQIHLSRPTVHRILVAGGGMDSFFAALCVGKEGRVIGVEVSLVRARARFECCKLVERDPVLEATQAADDTPVQSPTASNQPVNNAAS